MRGTWAPASSGAAPLRRGESGQLQIPIAGVTLLGVMLLVSVHGLLMGQAAETLDSLIRHDLEEELVFRGEEIRRGIEAYQKDHVGRLPTKLEDLCPKEKDEKRYIRRLWKDPMTGDELRLIAPAEVGKRRIENEERRMKEEESESGGLLEGFGGNERERPRLDRDDGPTVSEDRRTLPGSESKIELSGDRPFQGVASDSHEKAFHDYQGLKYYDEWEFVAQAINPVGLREQKPPTGVPPVTTPPAQPTPPKRPTPPR